VERYQQAKHVGGSDPGERDSAERWAHIEPHLPRGGVMLDVGSNLGWFGLSAIEARPDLAVVSLESSAAIAERQRALLVEHDTDRICLVRGALDAARAASWAEGCDWFELTLALAVLHWMDDPAAVLRALSSMSAVLIAEVPDASDAGACGREHLEAWGNDPVAWFHEQTGRECTLLGRIGRHTSDVPSHLILVHGPVSRRPSVPYVGFSYQRDEPPDYRVDYDGRAVSLAIRGATVADYRPGVNLVSLMRLGTLVHPPRATWLGWADRAITRYPEHGDPYPHNMIWTPDGLDLIDHDDMAIEWSHTEAMATFEVNLRAWERGRTTRYVRELLGPRRLLRRGAGKVARRVLGDGVVDRIKRRMTRPT
jgi:hypothetical protein